MDKRFIIIHASEIIQRGIQAILHQYYNADIILLKASNELDNFNSFANLHLILMVDAVTSTDTLVGYKNLMESNKNHVSIIALGESNNHFFDAEVSLNDTGIKIHAEIKGLAEKLPPQKEMVTDLSEREQDVLKLVALGYANKDIAEELYISIHTVISHRKNITEKLGIKSIPGLTVYAILNGLIDTNTIDPSSLI